jgi:hypothetical protein
MRSFYSIFEIVILLILLINPFLLNIFGKELLDLQNITKYSLIAIIILLEFIIITFTVKKLFHWPILKLEKTIKEFIV